MTKTLKRLAGYYKPYKGLFFSDLFFAILGAGITLVIPLIVRYITSTIVHLPAETATGMMVKLGIFMIVLVLIEAFCNFYIAYYGHIMGASIERDMRNEIFSHYQKLSFAFYDNQKVGHLLSRITADLFDISELLHHGPEDLVISIIKFVGAFAILVFIITTQLVRNLPALLELAILQHLDLTPGTGYAITTITKYLLMLIGGLVGFSMIGIEWSKLQWLVAALGVGLGFGLQEIFANFISGLIILFEKPIRIGDTVTIRDLTGSVTKINTRATTISDWDRKEIIVPNKAFITEQFINWSLSDSVTRVVLTIPAPANANSEEVTEILLTAARRCSLVIDNPAPEVFLVDLQQGIQIFELRIYAAEMGHRMPLRHEIHQLILAGFHAHGIDMPFPPFQMRLESLNGKQTGRTLTSAGKGRQAGSL